VIFVDSRIVGLEIRVASVASPNDVGAWVRTDVNPRLCLTGPGIPAGRCRINLRELTVPGSTSTFVSLWEERAWGLEIRPLAATGAYFCSATDATCGGCGSGSSFTCLGFSCVTDGGAPFVNYTRAYAPDAGIYVVRVALQSPSQPLLCGGH
jgi:hypothetical protein